jgi:hypothetical protein
MAVTHCYHGLTHDATFMPPNNKEYLMSGKVVYLLAARIDYMAPRLAHKTPGKPLNNGFQAQPRAPQY